MDGGIAFVSDFVVEVAKMPDTERDIHDKIERLARDSVFCLIEQAQARPGQAKTHVFFQNYGFLRGVLIALRVPFEAVSASKWQRGIGVPPIPKTKNQDAAARKRQHKNKLKQKAQELFPSTLFTLKTCDAVLIAEYARRRGKKTRLRL